jgi:hypothetical protein
MVKHDFRNEALAAAKRARSLLRETADMSALRYAALEVRFAMEALTYDRRRRSGKTFQSRKSGFGSQENCSVCCSN